MLHAPTSETKTKTEAGKPLVPVPVHELHPHFAGLAGFYPAAQRHQPLTSTQAAYGNQSVLRMLNATGSRPGELMQRKCACGGTPGPTGECAACRAKRLQRQAALQPKLTVGAANDHSEQEANRVAGQVMRMTNTDVQQSAPIHLQRRVSDVGDGVGYAPPSVHAVLSTSGQPLDANTRAFMEPRFGHDFSTVWVHTDTKAAASADDVGALAYTVGEHVVFAQGRYAPSTPDGRHLLAHELAHVAQQQIESDTVAPGMRGARLFPYRTKGKETIAFGKGDEKTLKEEEFHDAKKQPWIESILIAFDSVAPDTGHLADAKAANEPPPRLPKGKLSAKYHDGVLPDITIDIVGGSTMAAIGLTDRVKDEAVKRLEGLGYTDSQNIQLGNLTDPVAKTGHGARYSKSGAGTMNYAIFFKGIQAIHEGALDTGSHACVHVGAQHSIRQLNYHSVIGKTKVTVTYATSVLQNLCCHRQKSGNPHWDRNPCESIKASSCP